MLTKAQVLYTNFDFPTFAGENHKVLVNLTSPKSKNSSDLGFSFLPSFEEGENRGFSNVHLFGSTPPCPPRDGGVACGRVVLSSVELGPDSLDWVTPSVPYPPLVTGGNYPVVLLGFRFTEGPIEACESSTACVCRGPHRPRARRGTAASSSLHVGVVGWSLPRP